MLRNVYIVCIAIYLQTPQSTFGGIICPWSKQTAKKVSSCPNNRMKMEVRAKIKQCELKAHGQNCSSIEEIKYHCVMNELENAFIEVCAPVYRIHGYCTEYNEVGSVVQAHHNLKCTDVTPPCASTYLSTEAYLYKGCNDVVKKKVCESSGTSALSCPVPQYSSTDIYWLVSSTSSPSGHLTHSELQYNSKDWKPYNNPVTIALTTTALVLLFIVGVIMFKVYKIRRTKKQYKDIAAKMLL